MPFEVPANITSMFSLYRNSTKNRNNNITMIFGLDDISMNVKILISSFGYGKSESLFPKLLLAYSQGNQTFSQYPLLILDRLQCSWKFCHKI